MIIRDNTIVMNNQERTDSAILHLAEKSHTEEIGQVTWNGHNMTSLGILNFSTGHWKHLKKLALSSGRTPFIGDRGCRYLSRVPLPHIKVMDLSHNYITACGVAHLSKAPWKTLQIFSLKSSKNIERPEVAVHSLQMLVRTGQVQSALDLPINLQPRSLGSFCSFLKISIQPLSHGHLNSKKFKWAKFRLYSN